MIFCLKNENGMLGKKIFIDEILAMSILELFITQQFN
jgi:hypothetical protein